MSNHYTVKPVSKHAHGMHRWMVVNTKTTTAVHFTVTQEQALRIAADRNMHDDHERERRMVMNYVSEGLGEF